MQRAKHCLPLAQGALPPDNRALFDQGLGRG
jgi:hypothetical protein